MKSPLKWAGGKRRLAPILAKLIDPKRRLVEPFAGSAALTFHAEPKKALIADANPDLIMFYSALKYRPKELWRKLQRLQDDTSEEAYYAVRHKYRKRYCPARFYYLNRCGFQGLYRVNGCGDFNVPYGGYKTPRFMDREELFATSEFLQHVGVLNVTALDLEYVDPGDAVYADPPYHGTFNGYTKEGFTNEDHASLAQRLEELRAKGCQVVTTNRDCKEVRQFYPKIRWKYIEADSQALQTGKNNNKPELIMVGK